MRKSWEFTWDDVPQEAFWTSSVVPAGRVPRRMRRAWEFSWDDEDASEVVAGASGKPPGECRQAVLLEPAAAASVGERSAIDDDQLMIAKTTSVVAPGDSVDMPGRSLGRRRRRAVATGAVAAKPATPETPNRVAPPATTSRPAGVSTACGPGQDVVDEMDIAGVLRRLEAMGGDKEPAFRRGGDERVEWVKTGRGARTVQVVHVGRSEEDPVLRSDPLVQRAVRLAELLRSPSVEEQGGLGELRKAVREMRDAVAGAEAKAFSRPSRRVPLFFQAYDRRTRTG